MKTILNLVIVAICSLTLSCSNVPIRGASPVTNAGQSLNSLAAQATQAWIDYKAGRVDYAYAVSHALYAYQSIIQTKDDLKRLVTAWTGDGTFAEKLARIFEASTAPPEQKMEALAKGVTNSAVNKGA